MQQTAHYQPLIDRLTASDSDHLALTLDEIAALIDRPLPPSASGARYWRHGRNALPRALRAHGWDSTLDPDGDSVTFTRAAPGPPSRPSRLDPLLAVLTTHAGDTLRLSFAQLQELLGGHLASTARLDPAWWDGREAHARKWEALGWQARLDIRGRAVEFRRTQTAGQREQR